MNLIPHKVFREHTSEPLHQLLLNFGKGLWQWPVTKPHDDAASLVSADMALAKNGETAVLEARVRELIIKQLATNVRMHHDDSEELAMLNTLESLVLAGEITFSDFIGRLQNLFPKTMIGLDVSLRMKIAALMIS